MNNLLTVDLTTQSYRTEPIPDDVLDDFLGGRGLGANLLYKSIQRGIDPLSPENVLIFSSGPAQGTDTYYASRGVVNTKSPLTGIYLFSVASGRFGHDIKKAGYAAIVVRGRSDAPTYVIINDGEVEFRSAKPFMGLKTIETQEALIGDSGIPKASCICIGPAGESLHRMACVATAEEKLRTFGRGGAGAVMGSKNLKGIVLHGSGKTPVADPKGFKEVKQTIRENVKNNPQ